MGLFCSKLIKKNILAVMNFNNKKIIFVLCLVNLMTISLSCKKNWFARVTYEGHVYHYNGTPASNVSVVFKACGGGSTDSQSQCANYKFTLGTITTDASGYFHFHTDAAKTGIYFIECNGVGWNYYGASESDLSTPNYTKILIP